MAAGGAVEGQAASPTADPGVRDGRREIDLGESRLEWIGRNLGMHLVNDLIEAHLRIVVK